MTKMLRVALAQLSPRLRETEANIEMVHSVVAEHPEADLFAFPELFLSGYTVTDVDELAVRVDERGDIVVVYRKVQLYGGDESDAFVPGDELLVAELCGVKVGLMICFDVEFPEVARALAWAGAELLVTISANMEPFGNDHGVFASARALENGLPHAYVNQVGPGEKGLNFTGGSTIVSPDGEVHAQADAVGETVLNAGLSLPMKSSVREDYLSQLRFPMPQVSNVPSGTRPEART